MEVCNLMIGDLVYIHEPECKGHRIDSIDELDGQVGADGEVYDECDIRPIPLTEDILVKNGFEKTKGGEYKRTRYVMFSDKSWVALYTREAGGYSAFLNKIVVIHYVHQLQHLLRLCGIEKEIEL